MTSGNRLRMALLAAVLVVGLAGCADADAESAEPGSVAGEGPARPAAGGDDLVVDEQPLDAPVVLDPVPDGLLLTGISPVPPSTADGLEPARATLYGDPDLADTLDGPVLLVGRSSGSASLAGPPWDAPGEREVELGGRTGRVVPDSDRTWVVIDGNDYVEFVVGRGIDADELVEAARGADFESVTASLAEDAVPAGLEPLLAGSPQDGPYSSGTGQSMSLQGDDGTFLTVHAVRAQPRLAALWGFWVEDATGTDLRGSAGSAGALRGSYVGGSDARGRVWSEDGMVFSVVADRADDELVDRVVDGLRVGTQAEFEALDRQVRERPPAAIESPCPSDRGFVSGVEGASRWVFSLQPNPVSGLGEWSVCSFDLTGGSASGGGIVPAAVGELAVSGFGSGIVGGVAPPGTARVTVTAFDGSVLEAQLAADGPRPGERVWGTYIALLPPPGSSAPFTVTAYDAAGAVLASKAQ